MKTISPQIHLVIALQLSMVKHTLAQQMEVLSCHSFNYFSSFWPQS